MNTMRVGPGHFRLFLALLVVAHHSTPLRLGPWAVGLFFCLSGYWITRMWAQKYAASERPVLDFLFSRWWRLAPVLFFTTLLAAAVYAGGWIGGNATVTGDLKWWLGQPLIAGSTRFGRLLPPAWSLDVEMQFYLLAPLIMLLPWRRATVVSVVVLTIASLGWCVWKSAHTPADRLSRLDVWIGLFLMGVLSAKLSWRPSRRVVWASAVACGTFFIVIAAMPATRPAVLLRGSAGVNTLTLPFAVIAIVSVVLAVPLAIGSAAWPSTKADRFLGDLSYPLYLFHWLPRDWMYAHLKADTPWQIAAAYLFANVVIAVAGAVLILVLIDRPAQRARGAWLAWRRGRQGGRPSTQSPAEAVAGSI